MSNLTIIGDTSGSVVLQAPAVSGSTVLTLPTTTSTLAINGPAFSAYNNTGQSVSTNTATKLNFNTEEWDTNNNFASSRFTPTVAGYYIFTSNIGFQASNTLGTLALYKNGAASRYLTYPQAAFGAFSGSCMDYANGTTDYFELYIYIANGQNVGGNSSSGYFQGCLLRGA
jgi:hypothetical protein